jgi:hypothetical protein
MSTVIRLDDESAHDRAVRHAMKMLGLNAEPDVCWDVDHHLQGHLDVSGRHLVLIAPRTTDHPPRLLSELGWDRLRRACTRST